jgi:UDP-glucose 4-epimerase
VEWLLKLAVNDQANGKVFNLGNPEEITITDLAGKIIDLTGAEVEIEYIPYEKAYEEGFEDMERRVPDITKVQKATGYSPRVGLDQALHLTRDWFAADQMPPVKAKAKSKY